MGIISITPKAKYCPKMALYLKGSFLLNNPTASCSLINLDFLLLDTTHFDKSIVTFESILSIFFYFLNSMIII